MASAQEALGYARQMMRFARQSPERDLRHHFFQLARAWMAIALHEEKMAELNVPRGQTPEAPPVR
jgi:hypothetical protein